MKERRSLLPRRDRVRTDSARLVNVTGLNTHLASEGVNDYMRQKQKQKTVS
jgi:hypothetical protein